MKNGFIKQQTSLKKGLTLFVWGKAKWVSRKKHGVFNHVWQYWQEKKWLNGGLGKCCLITIRYNTWILIGYHPLIWNVYINGYSWILMNNNGYYWILTAAWFSLQAAMRCSLRQHNFVFFAWGRMKFIGFYYSVLGQTPGSARNHCLRIFEVTKSEVLNGTDLCKVY